MSRRMVVPDAPIDWDKLNEQKKALLTEISWQSERAMAQCSRTEQVPYIGTQRTNYVRVQDWLGLSSVVEQFGLHVVARNRGIPMEDPENLVAFLGNSDDGFFPSESRDMVLVDEDGLPVQVDADGEPLDESLVADEVAVEFSIGEHILPYLAEGEVLVVVSSGAEKMRYVTGYAEAFCIVDGEVRHVSVDIDDIYGLASQAFETNSITRAEY